MWKPAAAALLGLLGMACPAWGSGLEQSLAAWLGQRFPEAAEVRWEVKVLDGWDGSALDPKAAGELEYALRSSRYKKIMDMDIRRRTDQRQWRVKLHVRRMVKVLAAAALIPAGSPVAAAWQEVERDMDTLPADCIRKQEALAGQRARKIFRPLEVFTAHALEPEPAVKRGSRITLRVQGAGVAVSTDAVAMEDGQVGHSIPCRCLGSGQVVKAVVVNDHQAHYMLTRR